MGFGGFVSFVIVGVVVGWLSAVAMRDGGSGLIWDLVLGVAGSGVVTIFGWATGLAEGMGAPTLVLFAAIGAGLVIVAQRKFWPAAPPVTRRRIRLASRL